MGLMLHCRLLRKGKLEQKKHLQLILPPRSRRNNIQSPQTSDDKDSSKDIGAELITRKFWARAIDDDAVQTGVATVTGVGVFEADDEDWDTATPTPLRVT